MVPPATAAVYLVPLPLVNCTLRLGVSFSNCAKIPFQACSSSSPSPLVANHQTVVALVDLAATGALVGAMTGAALVVAVGFGADGFAAAVGAAAAGAVLDVGAGATPPHAARIGIAAPRLSVATNRRRESDRTTANPPCLAVSHRSAADGVGCHGPVRDEAGEHRVLEYRRKYRRYAMA